MSERSIRVLVAEDDDLAAEEQRSLLEQDRRIRVVGRARNGMEAVELTARLAPDVVLMDIEMPVLDGVEATRRIRSAAGPAAVIAVSGFDYQERALEIREAGAVDYLRKGRLEEELVPAVLAATRAGAPAD
jgi:DNA-binding NarL/FixJ family response regulator